jgi:hypothetical protein
MSKQPPIQVFAEIVINRPEGPETLPSVFVVD